MIDYEYLINSSKYLLLVALFAGVIFLSIGISKGQVRDAESYSSTICLSCLGIEEKEPQLTFKERAELKEIHAPVRLLLFTARGCQDCPKAHSYVQAIHKASNGCISYKEYDIRENQNLLKKYGIEYVPTVVVKGEKLEGLKSIREKLVPVLLKNLKE